MRGKALSLPDVGITLGLLILFGWALVQSRPWPFRASLFPTIVAILALLLLLLKLGLDLWRARRPRANAVTTYAPSGPAGVVLLEDDAAAEAEIEDVFESSTRTVWLSAIAWMAFFFGLLWAAGLLFAVPVFALVYLLVASREKPLAAVLYAAVSWIFVYGVFDQTLHIPLPNSVLYDLIAPALGLS